MTNQSFKPVSRYLIKMLVTFTIIAFLILVGGIVLAAMISFDDGGTALVILIVILTLDAIWWLVAMLLAAPYYKSLNYEVLDDEVIVRAGIFTHSVKHVPYRTVTNLTIKRDILDRWFFNLGSLHIQTAGMSGQTGAEEKLVGLENVQEVYNMVVVELRRFRSAMAPTAAEMETEPVGAPGETTSAILVEVQEIRRLLEK